MTIREEKIPQKLSSSISDEIIFPLIREAVRRQVEVELFLPLERGIRMVISDYCCERDCIVAENILKLRYKPQNYFGIPKSIQSPSNWANAAVLLREMFAKTIPFDRIEVLKAAIKEIPIIYSHEILAKTDITPRPPEYIGADDMLPIFIFLLATSDLPFGLFSFSFEIEYLCGPNLKMSETGYILATFEASVRHLADIADGEENRDSLFSDTRNTASSF